MEGLRFQVFHRGLPGKTAVDLIAKETDYFHAKTPRRKDY
jgi:hypothetical protein